MIPENDAVSLQEEMEAKTKHHADSAFLDSVPH